jgi:hypothetical protein
MITNDGRRTSRLAPAHRYPKDGGLQAAVDTGFSQMHDHDSFTFLDRMRWATDDIDDPVRRAQAMAAALEGAADALHALAASWHENARIERAIRDADTHQWPTL